jgi:hypothetical protein
MTRERWLTDLKDEARPLFRKAGYPLPNIEIDVGQCSHHEGSGVVKFRDRYVIFIDPQQEDVPTVVVRKLIRCATDSSGPANANQCAHALGLTNCMAMALTPNFKMILAELGPYPEK